MITTQEIQENVLSQVTGSEMNENDEPPSGLSLTNLLSDDPLYFNVFIETNRSLNHLSPKYTETSVSCFVVCKINDSYWQHCLSVSDPYFISVNNHLSLNTTLPSLNQNTLLQFGFGSYCNLCRASLPQHDSFANDYLDSKIRIRSIFFNKEQFMPLAAMKFDPILNSLYTQYQVCTPDGNQFIPRQPDY